MRSKIAADSVADGRAGLAERGSGDVRRVVDGAKYAACRAHTGVTEVRDVIRAQPITAALIVFALGYLFGRLGSLIPSSGWSRHD